MYTSAISFFLAWGTTRTVSVRNTLRRYFCRRGISSFISSPPPPSPNARKRSALFMAAAIVGRDALVHGARRLGASGRPDDSGRNPGNRRILGHVLQHHAACGNARALADADIAEHFGAGADHH